MPKIPVITRIWDWLTGWPYDGPRRVHNKCWFRDRADRRAVPPPPPRQAKRRDSEPLSDATKLHLDAVWLAVGTAFIIGGITLMTAGWLGHLAIVAMTETAQPSLGDEIFGWVLVGVGVFFFAIGIYVLRAFFRESRLPRTLRQQQDEQAKARAAAPVSVTETPKPEERLGAA